MKIGFRHRARLEVVKTTCGALVLAFFHTGAMGADIPKDSLTIAARVVTALSYDTPPEKGYIVHFGESFNLFSKLKLPGDVGSSLLILSLVVLCLGECRNRRKT